MARFFGVPMRNGVALGVASTLPMRGGLPVPALNLDFLSGSLDSRITFTRGSQATLFDSTGTLVYARHNLATNSESISAFGVPTNASLTSTAISTPLPSVTTAMLLVLNVGANTGNSGDGVTTINTVNLPTQTQVTYSAFVKAAGTTTFRIRSNITGSVFSFTLSGTGTAPTPSSDLQAATINALSDSWYRVTWTFTTTTGAPGARADYWTWKTDTANGIAGVYITGVQINITAMEGGVTSSLSTYYPTVASAYYAPRFDYNPSTLQPLGLLIEEQRTNSMPRSEEFSDASWTKGGATVTADSTAAPNGTTTADTLVEDTSTGQHRVYRTTSGTTNTNPYTISFFAKASTRTRVYVGLAEGTTFVRQGNAVFDLSAGTVVSASSGAGGATGGSATIQNVGNGWYRCAYTLTLGGTDTSIFNDINLVSTGTTISYTGNGTGAIFLWGAQLEAGAFATSYIPTTTTALTRNADVADITGANFSSWFNASEGTLLTQGILVGGTSGTFPRQAALVGSNPDSDSIGVYWQAPSGNMAGNVRTAGVGELDQSVVPAKTAGSAFKAAVAYKTNDANVASDGNVGTTDTTVTLPTVQSLRIGGQAVFQPTASSWLRRVSYYPRRLPDSTLQALTA